MCSMKCPLITSLFINKIIQNNNKLKTKIEKSYEKRQILKVLRK